MGLPMHGMPAIVRYPAACCTYLCLLLLLLSEWSVGVIVVMCAGEGGSCAEGCRCAGRRYLTHPHRHITRRGCQLGLDRAQYAGVTQGHSCSFGEIDRQWPFCSGHQAVCTQNSVSQGGLYQLHIHTRTTGYQGFIRDNMQLNIHPQTGCCAHGLFPCTR